MASKLTSCSNCSTSLEKSANFCPSCGQKNTTQKISFSLLLKDFLSDYFAFDSKLVRSIVPLIFKPGHLALEFVNGKRANYIPPFRMYVAVSFVFFLMLSFYSGSSDLNFGDSSSLSVSANDSTTSYTNSNAFLEEIKAQGMDNYLDSLNVESYWERQMIKQSAAVAENNGAGMSQVIFRNISILMFLLMPLFALLLKIFFSKSGQFYVEHLVHSLYIHSFLFLLYTILLSISSFFNSFGIEMVLLLLIPLLTLHVYFSLRRVYQYSRGKVLLRMMAVIPLYNAMLIIGLAAAVAVSLLQY